MRRAMIPLTLTIVTLAACSGGSSKAIVAANNSTTTTTTASGGTASTKPPSFSGSSSSNYCDTARRIEAGQKFNPTTDLKTAYQRFDKDAALFISIAPGPIKADARTLVDGVKKFEAALAAVNFDVTKINATTAAAFQDPAFAAAAERVSAYDKQVCGLGG